MDSEENQVQVSLRCPPPLEIAGAIPTFPQPRATTAMEKRKSNSRIPTFPRRFPLSRQTKPKTTQKDRRAKTARRTFPGCEAEAPEPHREASTFPMANVGLDYWPPNNAASKVLRLRIQ